MKVKDAVFRACLLEASARKPGNAHRFRDLEGLCYDDLLAAAEASAPTLADAGSVGVGRSVLEAIRATRRVIATNANLGIVLALAPLCALSDHDVSRDALRRILDSLSVVDSEFAYRAIREAEPGGLGQADDQDVRSPPTVGLTEAMGLAADRDSIARQYATGFADLFEIGLPALLGSVGSGTGIEEAIVWCHLHWMAALPDTLIARKRGMAEARESARRAQAILERLSSGFQAVTCISDPEVRRFDDWLTTKGAGRNPGTSADLVAATLFWALRTDALDERALSFDSR